ncbi:MAG TPA: hypothetical protein VND87_02650 [Stellaceae bacterium]|nr:hypothetical protein [Stellaceae bacterium]
MSVTLRHPVTGEIRVHDEGWSWSCFFGGVLGAPLFRRGLHVWGASVLVFDITAFVVGWIPGHRAASLDVWTSAIAIAASLFFGMKANAMATQRDLDHGWVFADRRQEWFR